MNLYRVYAVEPKRPGQRKHDVNIYVVMAPDAAEARRIVREDEHQEDALVIEAVSMDDVKSIRWFGAKCDDPNGGPY